MHQSPIIKDLRNALGGENVISAPSEMAVYDCDAYTLNRNAPQAVVFPRSAEQVADAVRICNQHRVTIVPRGAGTSLAGGCLPADSSVVLMLTRMNRVLEINLRDRWAVVEPGVFNSQLEKSLNSLLKKGATAGLSSSAGDKFPKNTAEQVDHRPKVGRGTQMLKNQIFQQAVNGTGYQFISKPPTQGSSTIGGNVATNASGQNALKYGATVNHVLGLEAVLYDGSIVQLGPLDDPAAFDLVGLLVGSEGTLAIVTKIWLQLTPIPQECRITRAVFASVEDAINTVTKITAAGIIPSAIELLDQGILTIVNESLELALPPDAAAALIIEIDGPIVGLDTQQEQIISICNQNNAKEVRQASSPTDRELLWKCRKEAIPSAGRISPTYLIDDCVVPRTQLPQMLQKIAEIGPKNGVRIMSVAHAAEGNIHPIILYDERDPASVASVFAAGRELLDHCIALGGSVTGEHGIGTRKADFMPKQFQPADLQALQHIRYSFDPSSIFNVDAASCRINK